MEVKVKKSVLFNLLKKRLSENRTYGDNPGGNFVHPFDINDGPIIPDSQMSTQLSTAAPPVEDPEYVPGTTRELRSSAERIAQEVPSSEIEYFYRLLHKSLDATLDRAQDQMISEAYTPGGFFDDGQDERYRETTYDEVDQTDDRFDSEMGVHGAMEDVLTDPLFEEVAQKLKEDPYYDLTDDVQRLSDMHGVAYNQIESALQGEYEMGSSTSGKLATTPTAPSKISKQTNIPKVDIGDDDELPTLTDKEEEEVDKEYDRRVSAPGFAKKEPAVVLPRSILKPAIEPSYWNDILKKAKEESLPTAKIISQAVLDSMDTISSIIALEYAVKYGYGGAGTDGALEVEGESSNWEGILSNSINTGTSVGYALEIKKKTKEFWKPRVVKFINKLGSGNAGSLTQFSDKFIELVNFVYDGYEKMTGEPIEKFLDSAADRTVDAILNHPIKGLLTRNMSTDSVTLLGKIIDQAFAAQLKKEPFNISNRKVFIARNPDPEEKIIHAEKEKTLFQAISDALVAYIIIQSKEFKSQSRKLDSDLENKERDAAIQKIIENLSDTEKLTYSQGQGTARINLSLTKTDIARDVDAYVSAKFSEASLEKEEGELMSDEDFADLQSRLEDPNMPEDEKKAAFTDEIASRIMQNDEGSSSSFRDYDYRVLSRKQKLAFDALKDDEASSEDVNYVNIFNDIMSELAPTAEKEIKEIESTGLTKEELAQLKKYTPYYTDQQVKELTSDVIRAAASEEVGISAVTRIVYGMPEKVELEGQSDEVERPSTRGGETLLQDVASEDLEFLVDSGAAGPSIVRNIVGSIMGKTLRGGGLQKIPDLDFNKINKAIAIKVVRSAVQVEKEMLKMTAGEFSGVDLRQAQDAAYVTATELGIKETKATFLEKNMKDFQIKTIYPFVGRVKRMPDFGKMNPAAKNFVCWFTAIADKNSGGASTMEERKATAKEIFDKLLAAGDQMINGKKADVRGLTDKVDAGINSAIQTEIEAIKMHSDKTVRDLVKNPKQLRDVIIQAIGMHIQDMSI